MGTKFPKGACIYKKSLSLLNFKGMHVCLSLLMIEMCACSFSYFHVCVCAYCLSDTLIFECHASPCLTDCSGTKVLVCLNKQ